MTIYVRDADGIPVDAVNLRLTVLDRGSTVLIPSWQAAPRIVHTATGVYTFSLGDIPFALETSVEEQVLFLWQADNQPTTTQIVDVATVATMMVLSAFQDYIDKSRKDFSEDPNNPIYLGYTQSQLLRYLTGGLSRINSAQPTLGWGSVSAYPLIQQQLLIDAATLVGIQSQELYAIDTDIDNFCLREGTPITRPDGTTTPIERLQVGDKVLDKNGQVQIVEAHWQDGNPAEIVELVLWGPRKVYATKEHSFPVWSWLRKCLCGCGEDLKSGNIYKVGHSQRIKKADKPEIIHVRGGGPTEQKIPATYDPVTKLKAGEIHVGDFLMIPRGYDSVETDVTPDEARLLGYYVAEGHLTKNSAGKARNLTWSFHTKEESTWATDIRSVLSQYGSKVTFSYHQDAEEMFVNTRNDFGRDEEVLRLASLAQYHCGEGSLTKCLSEEVMHWPLELKRQLIIGMMRGDGHQSWSEVFGEGKAGSSFHAYYNTSSPKLAIQVQLLLTQLGFPNRKVFAKGCKNKRIPIRGRDHYSDVADSFHIGTSQPYSFDLADMVWNTQSTAGDRTSGRKGWSLPRPEAMIDDDYVYVPIKEVNVILNDKPVYNLTVSNDHSFLIEGLSCFNSNQGNTYDIQHFAKLESFANALEARLEVQIPLMKLQYVSSGQLHIEMGPSFRLAQLLQASPAGNIFRDVFVAGSGGIGGF